MLTVIDTSDNGPAYVISTFDGNAHVVPRCVFQRVVSGELTPSDIGDDILRKMVYEWMNHVDGHRKPVSAWAGV